MSPSLSLSISFFSKAILCYSSHSLILLSLLGNHFTELKNTWYSGQDDIDLTSWKSLALLLKNSVLSLHLGMIWLGESTPINQIIKSQQVYINLQREKYLPKRQESSHQLVRHSSPVGHA